jgi:hypothetical protein
MCYLEQMSIPEICQTLGRQARRDRHALTAPEKRLAVLLAETLDQTELPPSQRPG